MHHMFLIAIDRGGNLGLILALAVLAASLLSLPLIPLFHYAQSQRLKHLGGRVYGFLGSVTMITGLILIPAALFVVVAGVVIRYRGTGIPQSLGEFALGGALWLSVPLVFIALGSFQRRFGRRLAPALWDKRARIALRRRKAGLRRHRDAP